MSRSSADDLRRVASTPPPQNDERPAMTQEHLLTIWTETEPTAKSPYALYGNPPMWPTFTADNGDVLFTCPAHVGDERGNIEPGIRYQWQRNGAWIDQGYSTTFCYFEMTFAEIVSRGP